MNKGKEWVLGEAEKKKAPLYVQEIDTMVAVLLNSGRAVLKSSHKYEEGTSSNLHKMLTIANKNVHLAIPDKAPKDAPLVTFIGDEFDLQGMEVNFQKVENTRDTWLLNIRTTHMSGEAPRTITIVDGDIKSDIMVQKDGTPQPLSFKRRALSTGSPIEEYPPMPTDGIAIFLGARLIEFGEEIATINALRIGD